MALAEAHKSTVRQVTAEELWNLSETYKNHELSKGRLIEMTPPGGSHGKFALRIGRFLQDFVDARQIGEAMVETGFVLTENPDTVRSPDASFISTENLPPEGLPDGFIPGAPDLAVEIVSPGDTAAEVQDKVQDYLHYGTKLVWVIYPRQRLVIVHYPDGTAKTLRETDTLSGESVVPGFSCPVKEIFS